MKKKQSSLSGNWTPVSRVTGGDTYHYTNKDSYERLKKFRILKTSQILTFSGKVPLKWMAPEAVHHRLYTSQSDIWSYGILLWEIMTMGESPFKDVHFERFMEELRTGAHQGQPLYCPNNVYIVMQACWWFRPEDHQNWCQVVDSMCNLCLGKLLFAKQLLHVLLLKLYLQTQL